MSVEVLASIYDQLAHALAYPQRGEMPDWLDAAGSKWPLFALSQEMFELTGSITWGEAVSKMAEVTAASPESRLEEYQTLFLGKGRSPIWLYESQHLEGHLPGKATFSVKKLYQSAGLKIMEAELPDHASLELAFLAFLAEQESLSDTARLAEQWCKARKLFIRHHAGRWLPTVGQSMNCSPFPAWVALGHLLVASLEVSSPHGGERQAVASWPQIQPPAECNLCGFCVQVCPTRALGIREDESFTGLWLYPGKCVGCEKCVHVCPEQAIVLMYGDKKTEPMCLRESPRALCPGCGAPTVSRAELQAVIDRIGHREWLDYCLNCR